MKRQGLARGSNLERFLARVEAKHRQPITRRCEKVGRTENKHSKGVLLDKVGVGIRLMI